MAMHDDRVICPHCSRRMVPRLIIYDGQVERTVCPFCAQTYVDFRGSSSFWRCLLIVVIGGFVILRIILPLMIWLFDWIANRFR